MEEDLAKLAGFMRAHSFGVRISAGERVHGAGEKENIEK
jgi:hypothetical protein